MTGKRGRPRTSDRTYVSLRVPRPLLARVDAEAERRREAGEAATRSGVIVEALERGLTPRTSSPPSPAA